MNSFFTGQVVVCVNPPGDGQWKSRTLDGDIIITNGPKRDEMCVIRGIDTTGRGLLLVSYHVSNRLEDNTEAGFYYKCFRPLVEYKNDISVFKALLIPAKEVHPLPVPHTSRP